MPKTPPKTPTRQENPEAPGKLSMESLRNILFGTRLRTAVTLTITALFLFFGKKLINAATPQPPTTHKTSTPPAPSGDSSPPPQAPAPATLPSVIRPTRPKDLNDPEDPLEPDDFEGPPPPPDNETYEDWESAPPPEPSPEQIEFERTLKRLQSLLPQEAAELLEEIASSCHFGLIFDYAYRYIDPLRKSAFDSFYSDLSALTTQLRQLHKNPADFTDPFCDFEKIAVEAQEAAHTYASSLVEEGELSEFERLKLLDQLKETLRREGIEVDLSDFFRALEEKPNYADREEMAQQRLDFIMKVLQKLQYGDPTPEEKEHLEELLAGVGYKDGEVTTVPPPPPEPKSISEVDPQVASQAGELAEFLVKADSIYKDTLEEVQDNPNDTNHVMYLCTKKILGYLYNKLFSICSQNQIDPNSLGIPMYMVDRSNLDGLTIVVLSQRSAELALTPEEISFLKAHGGTCTAPIE